MNIDSVTQQIGQAKIEEFFLILKKHEQNLSKLELWKKSRQIETSIS